MDCITGSLFPDEEKQEKEQKDEFAVSCRPLAELLDSVRHIEGFPLGRDEDILALSDPPYYTACPNPYIGEFIKFYGKPYDEATDNYERTPYVSDVSEGKNDPVYNAHSYHTKVPHKAIMKYIEHYTEEGDLVFDGFCGSGMTGVAAQLLGRRAVLGDLSPAATFIAYNYNTPVDVAEFEREAKRILAEVEKECGWMYETFHSGAGILPAKKAMEKAGGAGILPAKKDAGWKPAPLGRINYTVWSDVFICPYCGSEYVFWEAAVDKEKGKVLDKYPCPSCGAVVCKRDCRRATVTFYDQAIGQEVTQAKQVPVLINYTVEQASGLSSKRFEKIPDAFDLDLIRKIEESAIPYWFPTDRMPEGDESRRNDRMGITHVHHFYTKRNLWMLACAFDRVKMCVTRRLLVWLTSAMTRTTKMYKYMPVLKAGKLVDRRTGIVSGTLYLPSMSDENSPFDLLALKITDFCFILTKKTNALATTGTATELEPVGLIDYIFTDPPFGSNLMYSELNFLWEAWLKVFTNNKREAIINATQHKGLPEYKELMTTCFKEMYRILKPNRWMTVVFHNSKAAVWNAIQEAVTKAGFVVAQVTVMDRKQGSFKQVTSAGAVKNDLIINAYKPKKQLEDNFLKKAGVGLERDFVADLLEHLPVAPNIGRTEQMLYSKMLAHYVQRGYEIRLDARQFYTLLKDNFKLIDGYWFTGRQVLKYEEWKRKQGLAGIKEIKSG